MINILYDTVELFTKKKKRELITNSFETIRQNDLKDSRNKSLVHHFNSETDVSFRNNNIDSISPIMNKNILSTIDILGK